MPLLPVRRCSPYIGRVPTTNPVVVARRPAAILVAVALGGLPRGALARGGQTVFVRPPRPLVTFQPAPRTPDVFRRDQRGFPGRALFVQPPRPLVTFQAAVRIPDVFRRDQRGFAGRTIFVQPPRPLVTFQSAARIPDVFRRDQRGFAGRVLLVQPPRPLVTFQPAPRVPDIWRRDERKNPGRVLFTAPPRPRVDFAPPGVRALDIWQRPDYRFQRGRLALFWGPHRVNPIITTPPARPSLVARVDRRGFLGRVSFVQPPRPRVDFAPARARTLLTFAGRDTRFAGRVLLVRPARAVAAVFNLPARIVVVRRDERQNAGRVLKIVPPRPQVVFTGAGRSIKVARQDRRWTKGQVIRVQPPRFSTFVTPIDVHYRARIIEILGYTARIIEVLEYKVRITD